MNKIGKKQIIALFVIVALAGILVLFSVKTSNAGIVVYKVNNPIKISGFSYLPGSNSYKASTITLSDIRVLQLTKTIRDTTGIKKHSVFYALTCKVSINYNSKQIQFLFKGTGGQFVKPDLNQQNMKTLIVKEGFVKMFDGACYDVKTGKPINNYDFLIAPDFSFATFLLNPSGQSGFTFNTFYQVTNGKLILGIHPLESSLRPEVFFFENGVSFDGYLNAVKNGPIPEILRKKLGKYPSNSEIVEYIVRQLNVKP